MQAERERERDGTCQVWLLPKKQLSKPNAAFTMKYEALN